MKSWRKPMEERSYRMGCWHFVLAGVLLLAMVVGCAQTPESEKDEMAPTPAAAYRFEDVPIPRSLGIEKKESFIYESEAIKTGILVYSGKGKVREFSGFFKQNMATQGWTLVSNFERDDALLTFTKPGWGCVIVIRPKGVQSATVEVRVGPTASP